MKATSTNCCAIALSLAIMSPSSRLRKAARDRRLSRGTIPKSLIRRCLQGCRTWRSCAKKASAVGRARSSQISSRSWPAARCVAGPWAITTPPRTRHGKVASVHGRTTSHATQLTPGMAARIAATSTISILRTSCSPVRWTTSTSPPPLAFTAPPSNSTPTALLHSKHSWSMRTPGFRSTLRCSWTTTSRSLRNWGSSLPN